jgi:hypothetical protein
MLHPRQGQLITMFLQIPITQPTDSRQVLGFPIGIIAIQMVGPQNMQPYVGIFRSPAILTPILGAYFGKLGHSPKEIDPSLMSGLEKTVYLFLSGQPLHTHFPSSKPTRPGIACHPPMRPSTIPGRLSHRNQFGYFRFFSHCTIHHPTGYFLARPGGPPRLERMF